MAGKDRIVDMGSSSDTEDYGDLGVRRARSYRWQRHFPSSQNPQGGSMSFGGARTKDGSGVSTWSNHQAPANHEKITLVLKETRFVMEPASFTQHPDTMLGRMFSGVDYVQVNERG